MSIADDNTSKQTEKQKVRILQEELATYLTRLTNSPFLPVEIAEGLRILAAEKKLQQK